MAFRGNESPMDFKWDGSGPMDATSPFSKYAMDNAKKRSHSQFNSPQKGGFPSLREPNNQPYFFSQPNTTQDSSSPYRQSSFTTPRKPLVEIDFSSGPETSPGEPGDNDETPDGKPLPALPYQFQSKSTKRNSISNFFSRLGSSGRGEIKKPPSDALAKRIHKKRRQGQKFQKQIVRVANDISDISDAESVTDAMSTTTTPSPTKPKRSRSGQHKSKAEEVGWMTGLFTFIHTYPDAPSIIAKYLQVFFNAAILFSCLYMLWSFYRTIQADVDRASVDSMQDIQAEIAQCLHHFLENGCGVDRRPALETLCKNWETCMNRDPDAIRRASLSARTFAEIFNSFVEPISMKTMLFTAMVVVGALAVSNGTFIAFRKSQEHQMHNQYPHPYPGQWQHNQPGNMHQFPMTPGLPYQTPSQHNLGWDEQARLDYQSSPTKSTRGRSRSPDKKRLMLE